MQCFLFSVHCPTHKYCILRSREKYFPFYAGSVLCSVLPTSKKKSKKLRNLRLYWKNILGVKWLIKRSGMKVL